MERHQRKNLPGLLCFSRRLCKEIILMLAGSKKSPIKLLMGLRVLFFVIAVIFLLFSSGVDLLHLFFIFL